MTLSAIGRRQRLSEASSDLCQVILPILSLAWASVALLNLMRLVICYGSPVLLTLWAPGTTPLGISVISFLIVIASLWAILLTIIAFGENYPSRAIGRFLKLLLLSIGLLAIAFGVTFRASGWRAIELTECVYERFERQDASRLENFEDVKAVVEILRREGVGSKRQADREEGFSE